MNFMPGWFPGVPTGAVALSTLTMQASATSTADTITAPAGILAGDLLVLLDRAHNKSGGTPSTAVPTGFTSLGNLTSGSVTLVRQIVSYKLAVGSEAGAVLTGMNATTAERKILLVFRPNIPATTLTHSTPNGQSTASNPIAQTVLASGGAAPLVVIGCYGSDVTVDPRSFTPAKDGEVQNQPGSSSNAAIAWKIYNVSPADVTIDMDDEGSDNILQSFYIQVS